MKQLSCDVIVPIWHGERYIINLLTALKNQTVQPRRVLMVDSSSMDRSVDIARENGAQVTVIPKESFNHGSTRNLAVHLSDADVLIFMTQDALPENREFVCEILRPFEDSQVSGAYARQVPNPDAAPGEVFARHFNYPAVSHRRTLADVERLGVRAYFFSNVASAVRRRVFFEVGCFPERVPMNEDMILCSKMLSAGWAVVYAAKAVVRHSHNYSLRQQAGRYFDIGVFFSEQGSLLPSARMGGEGLRFAFGQMLYLVRHGYFGSLIFSPIEILAKWISFKAGQRHKFLPMGLKKRWAMHDFYWS